MFAARYGSLSLLVLLQYHVGVSAQIGHSVGGRECGAPCHVCRELLLAELVEKSRVGRSDHFAHPRQKEVPLEDTCVVGKHEHRCAERWSVAPQPFQSSFSHGPRWGPNLLRPMISAPMLGVMSR